MSSSYRYRTRFTASPEPRGLSSSYSARMRSASVAPPTFTSQSTSTTPYTSAPTVRRKWSDLLAQKDRGGGGAAAAAAATTTAAQASASAPSFDPAAWRLQRCRRRLANMDVESAFDRAQERHSRCAARVFDWEQQEAVQHPKPPLPRAKTKEPKLPKRSKLKVVELTQADNARKSVEAVEQVIIGVKGVAVEIRQDMTAEALNRTQRPKLEPFVPRKKVSFLSSEEVGRSHRNLGDSKLKSSSNEEDCEDGDERPAAPTQVTQNLKKEGEADAQEKNSKNENRCDLETVRVRVERTSDNAESSDSNNNNSSSSSWSVVKNAEEEGEEKGEDEEDEDEYTWTDCSSEEEEEEDSKDDDGVAKEEGGTGVRIVNGGHFEGGKKEEGRDGADQKEEEKGKISEVVKEPLPDIIPVGGGREKASGDKRKISAPPPRMLDLVSSNNSRNNNNNNNNNRKRSHLLRLAKPAPPKARDLSWLEDARDDTLLDSMQETLRKWVEAARGNKGADPMENVKVSLWLRQLVLLKL